MSDANKVISQAIENLAADVWSESAAYASIMLEIERLQETAWDDGFDAGIDNAIHKTFVYNPHKEYSEKAKKYIEERLNNE